MLSMIDFHGGEAGRDASGDKERGNGRREERQRMRAKGESGIVLVKPDESKPGCLGEPGA